jgi:hypothetical protein
LRLRGRPVFYALLRRLRVETTMSANSESAAKVAREVAAFLDAMGERKRANDVRRVCRTNDAYRATMQVLHRDNMALRAQLTRGKEE